MDGFIRPTTKPIYFYDQHHDYLLQILEYLKRVVFELFIIWHLLQNCNKLQVFPPQRSSSVLMYTTELSPICSQIAQTKLDLCFGCLWTVGIGSNPFVSVICLTSLMCPRQWCHKALHQPHLWNPTFILLKLPVTY